MTDPGKLEEVTASFTSSGRCETCNKRVRRKKSFTAPTVDAVVALAEGYNIKNPWYCKKHKPAPSILDHTLYVDRPDDEEIIFWLDGREVGAANHDEHGWAGMSAVENTVRTIAERLSWKVIEG